MPSAIPLPAIQGRPWRFGRRQRLSATSLKAYRPWLASVAAFGNGAPK